MRFFVLLLALVTTSAVGQDLKPWAGVVTPALSLSDMEGKPHKLADYRGKIVLLNFWATWCVPCRDEMPSIERLRASLEGRPFVVLAVNLAEPESRIRKFLEVVPVRFPVLLDADSRTARAWQARVLPATFIVGPDGVVRYQYFGELDWAKPEIRDQIVKLLR